MKKYPEHYRRWQSMKQRCCNPRAQFYYCYGARGIYVCEEWKVFKAFQEWCLKTFEPGKSLDRVNNDGPYPPSNCRWATPSEQQKNARFTKIKRLTLQKTKEKFLSAAKKKYGDPITRKEKFCPRCGHSFPLGLFYACKDAPDGRAGYCKKCSVAVRKMYRARLKNQLR